MSVPNFMWSCAFSTFVYLRNRTYIHGVDLSSDVPLTMLTSTPPDASKFCLFGCTVFVEVPDKLRRKLGEKAFPSVMVGYPHDAPGYRVYNPATRRITTSVHVVIQENTPGFGARQPIDSLIIDASDADDPDDTSPRSHPLAIDTIAITNTHRPPEAHRPPRLWSQPIRYGEVVAHLSDYLPVLVTTCCDP
jgi:hypothetical protein